LLGRRQTKTPVCQVGIKARQVYAVEDVEELEPQLEINPLGETCVFIEVQVRLDKVRRAELVGALIAFRAKCRLRELASSKGTVEKGVL